MTSVQTRHKPNGNQAARNRLQAVRVFKLHKDGLTVREIAELIGKQPHQVSAMMKIGERFYDSEER
jgi:IS30 family transposase